MHLLWSWGQTIAPLVFHTSGTVQAEQKLARSLAQSPRSKAPTDAIIYPKTVVYSFHRVEEPN